VARSAQRNRAVEITGADQAALAMDSDKK